MSEASARRSSSGRSREQITAESGRDEGSSSMRVNTAACLSAAPIKIGMVHKRRLSILTVSNLLTKPQMELTECP